MKKKNSILIVDDESANISALKSILGTDYVIYASSDGWDAIETADTFLPDVILLDVLMPGMDGYDIISTLKSSEKTQDIPVIFITGLDSTDAEEKGLALGAADYILKPFSSAIVKLRVLNQIKITNHTRALNERLRQQALMSQISHSFLSDAYIESMFTNTLQMVGEFMGITQILLYRVDDNGRAIVCYNEWINPELNLQTRIGERMELGEPMLALIHEMLSSHTGPLYLRSDDPSFYDIMKPYRKNFNHYITLPIFLHGNMYALLDFSKEIDEHKWDESEIELAILVSSVFASVFERDAMERQYSLVEHSPLLDLYITADGGIEYANPAVTSVTGYTKPELIKGGLGVFFDDKTLAETVERHIPNAKRQEEVMFEIGLTRKDGVKLIMMVSIFQTRNNKFGMIINDLTKIRKLEKDAEKIYYDGLTGIYNRRYFDEAIVRMIKTLSRPNGMLSLMIIDIDFFKNYNDTYGHSAGDECLKVLAMIFTKSVLRADDFVVRYGGEEFVVVLPYTGESGARIVADRLLNNVRKRNIPHENSVTADHITVSIGIVTSRVVHTNMADDYIDRADRMLYKSKQSGRNRYNCISF